jgi:hypothetical protein
MLSDALAIRFMIFSLCETEVASGLRRNGLG